MPYAPKNPSPQSSVPGAAGIPALGAEAPSSVVLGIDPGARGAMAAMDLRGNIIGAWDWPGSPADLWALVSEEGLLKCSLAAMEAQHGYFMARGNTEMGGGSAKINFGLGMNYGIWQGVAAVVGWPLELVSTTTWRKVVFDSTVPNKPQKKDIVAYVTRRWPLAPIKGTRGGAKDGRAEAVCLAEYARQRMVGR